MSVTVGRVPELSVGSGYLLLVDDVTRTGKTLRKVADAIKRKHNVEVVTCTVFYSQEYEVKPDIYAKEVSRDKWIIFGYEKEFDKRFKKNKAELMRAAPAGRHGFVQGVGYRAYVEGA